MGLLMSFQCIQGIFNSQVVEVILGSFVAFPIFDNLVSRKHLVVERHEMKSGPRGVYSLYTGSFDG